MSDQLSAAAEAMGVPEPLLERSAHAWAEANGQTYEDVIAAWAGGEAVSSAPAAEAAPTEEAVEEAPDEGAAPEAPAPEPAEAPAPAQPAAAAAATATMTRPAPTTTGRPPILEAPPDRPLVTILGGIGVLVMAMLLGFVFPSLPNPTNEVRSSNIAYTEAAQAGREVYLSTGCASCHTQSVRSVVADVGIGPVSLPDTNQVLGYRRIGPDLSDVGTRLTADQIASVISGPTHPPLALSGPEMEALVAYLSQSATSPPGTGDDGDEEQAGSEGDTGTEGTVPPDGTPEGGES